MSVGYCEIHDTEGSTHDWGFRMVVGRGQAVQPSVCVPRVFPREISSSHGDDQQPLFGAYQPLFADVKFGLGESRRQHHVDFSLSR